MAAADNGNKLMKKNERASEGNQTIAVIGLRGIPATWGGVERQCEELYARLAAQGFQVVLYARKGYLEKPVAEYRGVRILTLPSARSTHLEAISHTFLCVLHMAVFLRPAVVHVYSQGPCLVLPLLRVLLPSSRILFTCGGLDWQRKKWTAPASWAIRLGEFFSAKLTHRAVVVSRELGRYYLQRYRKETDYIPNGVNLPEPPFPLPPTDLGLVPKQYDIFVGRLVPEKRIENLIRAYSESNDSHKLVVAGGSAGRSDYERELQQLAEQSPNIVLAGYRFDQELVGLFANARAYVTASELEGLPLTLLEGMSFGLPCVASDIPPHREALGQTYPYFYSTHDVRGLRSCLDELGILSPSRLAMLGENLRTRVAGEYSWDDAACLLGGLYRKELAVWTKTV